MLEAATFLNLLRGALTVIVFKLYWRLISFLESFIDNYMGNTIQAL